MHHTYDHGDEIDLPYWGSNESRAYRLHNGSVAVMTDAYGTIHDVALNWETAESMILNDGYIGIPIGAANRERYALRFEALRELYVDCWGM